jgi:hypothetical protein
MELKSDPLQELFTGATYDGIQKKMRVYLTARQDKKLMHI